MSGFSGPFYIAFVLLYIAVYMFFHREEYELYRTIRDEAVKTHAGLKEKSSVYTRASGVGYFIYTIVRVVVGAFFIYIAWSWFFGLFF